jgi:preprotein translocase subunit SecG
MHILLVILHVVVCIALIMIVLLQTGKGADMGAAFGGGGSQTLFGATGASTFLSKATTAAAVIFMLTSLILAYKASDRPAGSLMSNEPPAVEQAAPPAAESQGTNVTEPSTESAPAVQETAPAAESQGTEQTTTAPKEDN